MTGVSSIVLFHAAQTYYAVNAADAARLVERISIYHPYGFIGPLPGQLRTFNGKRSNRHVFAGCADRLMLCPRHMAVMEGTMKTAAKLTRCERQYPEHAPRAKVRRSTLAKCWRAGVREFVC